MVLRASACWMVWGGQWIHRGACAHVPHVRPTGADDSGTYSGHGRCTSRRCPPPNGPLMSQAQSVAGRMSVACAEVKGRPLRWTRASLRGFGGGGAAKEAKCRDCKRERRTEREVVCEGASAQGGGVGAWEAHLWRRREERVVVAPRTRADGLEHGSRPRDQVRPSPLSLPEMFSVLHVLCVVSPPAPSMVAC